MPPSFRSRRLLHIKTYFKTLKSDTVHQSMLTQKTKMSQAMDSARFHIDSFKDYFNPPVNRSETTTSTPIESPPQSSPEQEEHSFNLIELLLVDTEHSEEANETVLKSIKPLLETTESPHKSNNLSNQFNTNKERQHCPLHSTVPTKISSGPTHEMPTSIVRVDSAISTLEPESTQEPTCPTMETFTFQANSYQRPIEPLESSQELIEPPVILLGPEDKPSNFSKFYSQPSKPCLSSKQLSMKLFSKYISDAKAEMKFKLMGVTRGSTEAKTIDGKKYNLDLLYDVDVHGMKRRILFVDFLYMGLLDLVVGTRFDTSKPEAAKILNLATHKMLDSGINSCLVSDFITNVVIRLDCDQSNSVVDDIEGFRKVHFDVVPINITDKKNSIHKIFPYMIIDGATKSEEERRKLRSDLKQVQQRLLKSDNVMKPW